MKRRCLEILALILLGAAVLMLDAEVSASPNGDTFTFDHQLGFLEGEVGNCFSVHMAGMNDNSVVFDGITEFLDAYTTGTQPFIFEFETTSLTGGGTSIEIITMGAIDLFPDGFEDPKTGTPLTAACIEIGIDDTLDFSTPTSVPNATVDLLDDMGSIFGGPLTIPTSFFSDPWDGRLSLVVSETTGLGITELRLKIDTQPAGGIFADGFESGDATAWTEQTP